MCLKVGVYIDSANIMMNGGFGMRYRVLRNFASRNNVTPLRLNCYITYDLQRAEKDYKYKETQERFQSELRDMGYKVIRKMVKWYTDADGMNYAKANADLDLAVDALLQSENLDQVLLVSGDGDFVQVVKALQNKGCRVEVMSFDNVSLELIREADFYISGFLIPGLLPIRNATNATWGEKPGCCVRGTCYTYDPDKGYGFIRYLRDIEGDLWRTDNRDPRSPYQTIFFHESDLPRNVDSKSLPRRNLIFEFQIQENEKDKFKAVSINCIEART